MAYGSLSPWDRRHQTCIFRIIVRNAFLASTDGKAELKLNCTVSVVSKSSYTLSKVILKELIGNHLL